HFFPADRILRGNDLPVDVGTAHRIIVNENKRTHAASRQRLHHISADAADAEDRDPGGRQFPEAFLPDQHLCPLKTLFHLLPPLRTTVSSTHPENRYRSDPGSVSGKSCRKMLREAVGKTASAPDRPADTSGRQ